jgi:ribosomal protein L11 methyltransferase
MFDKNPFQQNPYNWIVSSIVTSDIQNDVQNYFDNLSDVVSIFEKSENIYELLVYFDYKPDIEMFKSQLSDIFGQKIVEMMNVTLSLVEEKNWVEEVQKNFIPISSGQFYIYNSFNDDSNSLDTNIITIKIDPGRAFGTGEHETTKLCLKAISDLAVQNNKILDLGCGSAILAIAAQKKFLNADVLAVDIDSVAIEVAQLNCSQNNCNNIKLLHSEDFFAESQEKYDLLIANILANPLIEMSSDIVNATIKGGKIILSGFLESQEEELVRAYIQNGCKLYKRYVDNKWLSIVFEV